MNQEASKNVKKRPRTTSKSKNSFVQNVTCKVSSLFPSAIQKWFKTSSTSTNGSTPKSDASDSSSEDELSELIFVQPPAKRRCFNTENICLLNQSATEVNDVTSSVDAIESNDMQSSTHTVIDEPSNEERHHKSTVIQTQPYSTKNKKRKSLNNALVKVITSQGNKKTMNKASSLNDYSQPYFKPNLAVSSFYQGKVVYGGAASSYMNEPNVKISKTATVKKNCDNDNDISYPSRHIMELLEHCSSPMSEAKRISPYMNTQNNVSPNKTIEKAMLKNQSFKTQELHVPSIATTLSLKCRTRQINTTNAVRRLIASHSSTTNNAPYPSKPKSKSPNRDDRETVTTKVLNTISRTKNAGNELINDLVTPTKLPTAVLDIDQNNLPKFNFSPIGSTRVQVNVETIKTPLPTSLPKCAAKSKEISIDVQSSEVNTSKDRNSYKFGIPVTVSLQLQVSQSPKFKFQNPVKFIGKVGDNETKKASQISITCNTLDKNTEKPKDWKCSECWVNNKADTLNCVCCSAKKPGDNNIVNACLICYRAVAEGTDQDKCSKCKESQISDTPLNSSIIWKCGDCCIDNSETSEKCVGCGLKNPKFSKDKEIKPNAIESDWKCNDCWVKNKHNIEKCIACGGVKSKSASSTPTIPLIPAKNLMTSSFNAKDKWECTNCLVRNDNDKTKCVCCETEKTGVIKEAKTSFNFGINTGTTFKFGINPVQSQLDKSNKDTESEECIKQSSETNNNILAKTLTPTFGLHADDENKCTVPAALSKVVEAPKLNFSFGIPKQTNQTVSNIIEGNSKEKESIPVNKEKLPLVPSITNTPTENVGESKNIFGYNKSTQESLSTVPSSTSLSEVVTTTVTEVNSIVSKPLVVQTTTATETSKANPFTLASGQIMSNLFTTPASTIENAQSSNNSGILPVPITTSTPYFNQCVNVNPGVGLFQKVESTAINSNLFQNPSTTSSQVSASTIKPSQKIFSFGSNTPSSLKLDLSQRKFNFNFGNTKKTDTPSALHTFDLREEKSSGQNKNMWSNNTNGNLYVSSSAASPLQRAATYSFGPSPTFSINNNNTGISFENTTSSTFNIVNPTSNLALFSSPSPPQVAPNIFGNRPESSNVSSSVNIFGNSNPTNNFNVQNPPVPSFEPQAQNPVPAPSFAFRTQQLGSGVFGFGQQQAQQQPQPQAHQQAQAQAHQLAQQQAHAQGPQPFQNPVFGFGASQGTPQFNMGSAPTVRRIRKAVRRTQR